MEATTIKLRWIFLLVIFLLGSYVALCVYGSGKTLKVMEGVVEHCGLLGGNNIQIISHATIKTELGAYIISSLSECRSGAAVTISVKRGILFFNSIYAAEIA